MIAAALKFATGPAGRVLAVIFAAVLAVGWAYARGKHHAEEACEAAALRVRVETLERDLFIARAAAADENAKAEELEVANDTMERLVEAQREALAAAGDAGRCHWAPDELGRLRQLLGQ